MADPHAIDFSAECKAFSSRVPLLCDILGVVVFR